MITFPKALFLYITKFKKGRIKVVDVKELKIEMRSRWKDEWNPTTPEKFLEVIHFTREVIKETGDHRHDPGEYSDERAADALARGQIVSTPALLFKLAGGIECPRCHAKFLEQYGALSRSNNKALICDACGMKEAMTGSLASEKKSNKRVQE